MARHCNWRDCQAWRQQGLELSSTSNEAVKLYDASLTQLVGWYEDDSVGGLSKSMTDMVSADNNFVMGHALKNAMTLIGHETTSPEQDPSVLTGVQHLVKLADAPTTTRREKLHIEAVQMLAESRKRDAIGKFEDILLEYPTDMHAIKLSEFIYFLTGDMQQQRDSKYRVFPHWNQNIPLYSYLYGMLAFGEMGTGFYEKAEKNARKAYELNPLDGWAIHAMSHVLDDTGRFNEGIEIVTSRAKEWTTNQMIACHIHWHVALYYIEKGDLDAALSYIDTELTKYNDNMFHAEDRTSILLRLEMEGVDVGNRWKDAFDLIKDHTDNHVLGFGDIHCMMGCLGAKHRKAAEEMLESMREFIKSGSKQTEYRQVAQRVTAPLCEALLAWDNEDFGKVVDLIMPIRYETNTIGGSAAQRDVINQLLIHSAIRSPERGHKKLARALIYERKAQKDTPLTARLMEKMVNSHDD